ncbi:hypothetical protein OD91_1294 [Lutibacter sp. Hel_I_33_5]|uniref:hypothetical protein n=1 Tax=Lutibacter sp. Hel_I_33_5 TaxID=1566289 RepID=UPI0011A9B637|nr:hypothetical protein [Lutibacter sp. Hel_I_33_5]TVZ56015.1 hypothetical protein OD91_1294 [Lutibacter sp. Hel_I_33_5]
MEINKEALQVLSNFDEESPVFMMNYLNYKDVVSPTSKSGKEIYKEYMKAAFPFFQKINAEIIFKGKPQAMILGSSEEKLWDEILIVKYANKNEFFKLLQFKEYPRELRASALSESKLIFCK